MKVYSMFAGIGGMDLGLESTGGYDTVLFSEVDQYCNRVLAHHWPDVPNIGDCTKADYSDWVGKIGCDTAGFPCQDISVAGKQEGIKDGTRSGLWDEVVRAIRILRPQLVILENVAAIVTSNGGSDFNRVLADIHESGYDAQWQIVRASDVGAYHQRARWFCVCWPRELGNSTGEGFPEWSWGSVCQSGPQQRPERSGSLLANSSSKSTGYHKESSGQGWQSSEDNQSAVVRSGHREANAKGPGTSSEKLVDSGNDGLQGRRTAPEPVVQKQWDRQRNIGSFARRPRRSDFWDSSILYRGRPVEPSIPLLADGVPDRVARIRAAGNAVVTQVAEYVGRQALKIVGIEIEESVEVIETDDGDVARVVDAIEVSREELIDLMSPLLAYARVGLQSIAEGDDEYLELEEVHLADAQKFLDTILNEYLSIMGRFREAIVLGSTE